MIEYPRVFGYAGFFAIMAILEEQHKGDSRTDYSPAGSGRVFPGVPAGRRRLLWGDRHLHHREDDRKVGTAEETSTQTMHVGSDKDRRINSCRIYSK